MSKKILFSAFALTLLAFGVWFVVLNNISPKTADFYVKIIFFFTFFVWTTGLLTFSFYLISFLKNKIPPEINKFFFFLRISILITFIITILLILQTLRVLTIWDALLLIIAIILIELFIRTRGVKYD